MKKLLALALAATLTMSLTACGGDGTSTSSTGSDASGTGTGTSDYKIAIITGTVSQGEEEFRAAENLKNLDPNKYVVATYPDNFTKEQETTISNVVNLVSDPAVKGLVILQAVPGSAAAIEKAREINPELIVVVGVVQEDPGLITSQADFALGLDEPAMGYSIPAQAQALGAKTFVHYSFPRHMSIQAIADRAKILEEECTRLGIKYVSATAPDPTSEAGPTGAAQFIIEDVPKMVAQYGKDTAFFSTNCSMQEPLIKQVIATGAIMPQQCCPSPYHGYPGALSLSIPADKAGDVNFILEESTKKITEMGNAGRMSTWTIPANMMFVDMAASYIDGRLGGTIAKEDDARVAFEKIAKANTGDDIAFKVYKDGAGKEYPNYFVCLGNFYTYGTTGAAPAGDTSSAPATDSSSDAPVDGSSSTAAPTDSSSTADSSKAA